MLRLEENRIYVVAEVANAHNGHAQAAAEMIRAAAEAGADAVKFQVFTAEELAVPSHSSYALYRQLQMPEDSWSNAVALAHSLKLDVLCDVFGLESLDMAERLGVDGYKVHTADVTNTPLLERLGATGRPVLLSTGGSTWLETAGAAAVLKGTGAPLIVLMHGFQGYPTRLEETHLRRIRELRERFTLSVGFSGHVDGGAPEAIWLPLWAAAVGAELVEVHITLDRSAKGHDYYSSLEPARFAEMVRLLRSLEVALGSPSLCITDEESAYRKRHRKLVVTTENLREGDRLTPVNIALKRVEGDFSSSSPGLSQVFGRRAIRSLSKNAPVLHKDIEMKAAATLACRAESTRLYGKPLQLVGGRPILSHLIGQLRQAKSIDEIVLAISDGASRSVFVDYAEKAGLPYIVGDEKNVLGRLIQAADLVGADIAVRNTTENPFIYWQNLDELIRLHIETGADLTVTEKLPLGAAVEIISVEALRKSHQYGEERHQEHCAMFIAEHPESFTVQRIAPPEKLRRPEIRLTVDTPEDLILVRAIWDALHRGRDLIDLEEIIDFLDAHPDLASTNGRWKSVHLWE